MNLWSHVNSVETVWTSIRVRGHVYMVEKLGLLRKVPAVTVHIGQR